MYLSVCAFPASWKPFAAAHLKARWSRESNTERQSRSESSVVGKVLRILPRQLSRCNRRECWKQGPFRRLHQNGGTRVPRVPPVNCVNGSEIAAGFEVRRGTDTFVVLGGHHFEQVGELFESVAPERRDHRELGGGTEDPLDDRVDLHEEHHALVEGFRRVDLLKLGL